MIGLNSLAISVEGVAQGHESAQRQVSFFVSAAQCSPGGLSGRAAAAEPVCRALAQSERFERQRQSARSAPERILAERAEHA